MRGLDQGEALAALAARVEAATGPDADLLDEVSAAFGRRIVPSDSPNAVGGKVTLPNHYFDSDNGPQPGRAWACITRRSDCKDFAGKAATRQLALCAAALRALREHIHSKMEGERG